MNNSNPSSAAASHLAHPKYRPDIDGLRAVAVLSVVIFHAFPDSLPGGFIGVDIFFVISGYLISTIIFGSLETRRFSYIEFYIRRIRRIFPALLLVLFSSILLGWFTLLADEYRQLGKHILGGAIFVSNFFLWTEAGYFDTSAEMKPLLHLWSLAIEEQFYIVWPILMGFVWKRGWNFLAITLVVATLSFFFNVYQVAVSLKTAFYIPFSRFWELMVGGGLAYLSLHKGSVFNKRRNAQSIAGLVLISIGLVFINKTSAFPGWWALVPTLGAFLIISAGPGAWVNSKILAGKPFVAVGLISYPLYLWHWPLISFGYILGDQSYATELRVAAVITSFILATMTYQYVEKPIRHGASGPRIALGLCGAMFLAAGFGYYCYKSFGFNGLGVRSGERQEYADYFENSRPRWAYYERIDLTQSYRKDCDFYDMEAYRLGRSTNIPLDSIGTNCYSRDSALQNAVFIWGDSHAQQLFFGLSTRLPKNWQILQVATSGCPPKVGVTGPSKLDKCVQSNWAALNAIQKAKPDVVILAQDDGHDVETLRAAVARLKSFGIRSIILAGPAPHWTGDLPKIALRRLWPDIPRRTLLGVDQQVVAENARLRNAFIDSPDVIYADLIGLFCGEDGCSTYVGEDQKLGLTTWDRSHLTPAASEFLAAKLLVQLVLNGAKQDQ